MKLKFVKKLSEYRGWNEKTLFLQIKACKDLATKVNSYTETDNGISFMLKEYYFLKLGTR